MRPLELKFAAKCVREVLATLEAHGAGDLGDDSRIAKLRTWLERNKVSDVITIDDAREAADTILL